MLPTNKEVQHEVTNKQKIKRNNVGHTQVGNSIKSLNKSILEKK